MLEKSVTITLYVLSDRKGEFSEKEARAAPESVLFLVLMCPSAQQISQLYKWCLIYLDFKYLISRLLWFTVNISRS